MESSVLIKTNNLCLLEAVDDTIFDESSIFNPCYDEVAFIDVLVSNKMAGDEIVSINVSYDGYNKFQLSHDGKFTIHHYVVPTEKWLSKYSQKELEDTHENIYVYKGKTLLKKEEGDTFSSVPLEEIINLDFKHSTIRSTKESIFSLCYLTKCFLGYAKDIFKTNLTKCVNKDLEGSYNRDFVWMVINVIKYYIEFGQLEEAQRLLEETMSCNGFCKSKVVNYKLTNNSVSGCGCSS